MMKKDIEYKKIKEAILNDKKSEEYIEWLNQDKKNLDIEACIYKYYDKAELFETSSGEIEDCWKEFERMALKKRRFLVRVAASVASVAAIVAFLLFTFNVQQNDKEKQLISNLVEGKSAKMVPLTEAQDNIILKTETGTEYILSEENIDFTKPLINIEEVTKYQTISVPKGMSFKVVLSDSTVVHLNNQTEFTYPVNFVANEKRVVTLKGEAYFEVAKDEERQFVVETVGMSIKVYGTRFNVNTNKSGIIETVLVEGSVSAQPEGLAESLIKPNQMFKYNRETAKVEFIDVDVNNYISWVSGIYRFNRQSLENIMSAISLWYDVEVIYEDIEVKELECICNIPRYNSIGEVLDILKKSGNIGYRKNGRKIYMWSLK